jgi:hypothetical protein
VIIESFARLKEVEQAKISDPAVIEGHVKRSSGCGIFYVASNALIFCSYSLINISQPMLCADGLFGGYRSLESPILCVSNEIIQTILLQMSKDDLSF